MIDRGETLTGRLIAERSLSAKLHVSANLRGELSKNTNYTNYTGDYEIIPKVEAQTMFTKNKLMINDVEIKGVPIFSTSNNAGGNTVYIAKEVE